MPAGDLTKAEQRLIKSLLQTYLSHRPQIELFHDQFLIALKSSAALAASIHSMRSRLKDPDHLTDKLARKISECKLANENFDIAPDNLLVTINDLVGVRLLHLYTRQIPAIDAALRDVFKEGKYDLLEGPFARTWDDESRQFFKDCHIETQESPSMYTSVHYVIGSASRTTVTAEIQVRTLMEEVWGEVDHTMNYPHPVSSVSCREQLKVLARVTSSASRLVDSIFATVDDHNTNTKKKPAKSPRRKRS
jgi:ppGpp synthetase/RelA/SpoT-type nucleotidyltranferase